MRELEVAAVGTGTNLKTERQTETHTHRHMKIHIHTHTINTIIITTKTSGQFGGKKTKQESRRCKQSATKVTTEN